MYIARVGRLVFCIISCLIVRNCAGFQGELPNTLSLHYPYGSERVDNHQTMLDQLKYHGALPDIVGLKTAPRREFKHPLMKMVKRNTITMQRPLKMDDDAQKGAGRPGDITNEADYRWNDNIQVNITTDDSVPTISFKTVEENTIELLVVVTRKMHLILKGRLTEYLVATIGSVAQNFKHSSLKSSLKVSIVDIILLDSNFARREGLEDWSNKNHEEVMGKFCHWVNRIRRPTMNWDSAILLNVGNFKTTALGVAHYRAMCSLESSCLVVVDRGFGTADIIAHEIGHQLGAKHDFEEGSECGLEEQPSRKRDSQQLSRRIPEKHDLTIQPDTVMSGILYFELYPFRWSACSRKNIKVFLSRSDSSCLRKKNSQRTAFTSEQLAQHTTNHKPGLRFSLNDQCELALRQRGSQFCGHSSPVCKQLHCYDVPRGMCLPVEAPWAEGSRCGYNRWCVLGHCLPKGETLLPVHGGWSSWDDWGVCSRSCGGGVQFSSRECTSPEPENGGDQCVGTNVRVRSCNVQDCPQNVDIRQQLCDELGSQLNKNLHAFKPSIGGSYACRLVCLDGTKEIAHNESLPDGTPCYAPGNDICIRGKCWQVGCDKVLGSQVQTDNCNVCGGDNSTCDAVSGVFRHADALTPDAKPVGLTIAVHIPQGVTNAFIKKVSRRSSPFSSDAYDDFMLLIFEELKTRIRRGETREAFAGAELYYSGSRKKEEVVEIKGKLNKTVNILIRVENKNTDQALPNVEYTYYVSKNADDYLRFDPSGIASEQYNDPLLRFLRSPRREMPVKGRNDDITEPRLSKPQSTASPKSDEPIRFDWKTDEVPKECTSCVGIVESHASCYAVFGSAEATNRQLEHAQSPLPAHYCGESSRPSPVKRNCANYCGVRWSWKQVNASHELAANYASLRQSACSKPCGEGTEVVRYVAICEELVQRENPVGNFWQESASGAYACIKAELGKSPADRMGTVRCVGQCRPLQWVFSEWHECSERCGLGTKQRTIKCMDDSGNHWPLAECAQSLSAVTDLKSTEGLVGTESADCFEVTGCGGELAWTVTSWSECRAQTAQSEMENLCQSGLKRYLKNDEVSNALASGFMGTQTRNVICVLRSSSGGEDSQREAPDEYCEHDQYPKPPDQQSCDLDFTCYRWSTVKFSQCSSNCGTTGQRLGELSCEEVIISTNSEPVVNSLRQPDCLHRLGANVSLFVDISRSDEATTVFIADVASTEAREITRRETQIRPVAFTLESTFIMTCITSPCQSRSIEWIASDWSSCSASCGVGVQQRSIRCGLVTRLDVTPPSETIIEEKSNSDCTANGIVKPPDMRLCEAQPCLVWSTGDWEECNGICESGKQTRRLRCIRQKHIHTISPEMITWHSSDTLPGLNSSLIDEEISHSECEPASRPVAKRACLLDTECPFWYEGPWSSCSATCGAGRRFRQVDCRFPNGTVLYQTAGIFRQRNMFTSASKGRQDQIAYFLEHGNVPRCLATRPVDKTECQLGPCSDDSPFWWPSIASNCKASHCQRGYQQRDLQCLTPTFQQVDADQCINSRKPPRKVPCTQRECKTYTWRADAWTRCPSTCGKHSRHRNVRCVDDLGEEYADRLCLPHLRPDSWDNCPNACPDHPNSCWDQKQRYPSSIDDIYKLSIHRQVVPIHCSDMNTSYPKEYLPLHNLNYASITDFIEMGSKNCSPNSPYFRGQVTDFHETSDPSHEIEQQEVSKFPSESVTVFKKLRINLNSLHIDIFDRRFTETWGNRFVPYASAKSCSNGTCRLGKFLVNLRGTGFVVSKETQWRVSRFQALGQVKRFGDSSIVVGTCGGDCGGCWPHPVFQLTPTSALER